MLDIKLEVVLPGNSLTENDQSLWGKDLEAQVWCPWSFLATSAQPESVSQGVFLENTGMWNLQSLEVDHRAVWG